MTPLAARAHAKINLDLRIVGRRDDGYHDLRTIFQSLALHDRLVFRQRRGPFEIESAAAKIDEQGARYPAHIEQMTGR